MFAGYAPSRSLAPTTAPPGMPAPAAKTEKQCGQWSRPPYLLIFGVRPNSPKARTSVDCLSPRCCKSSSRAESPWSKLGTAAVPCGPYQPGQRHGRPRHRTPVRRTISPARTACQLQRGDGAGCPIPWSRRTHRGPWLTSACQSRAGRTWPSSRLTGWRAGRGAARRPPSAVPCAAGADRP